MTRRSLHFAAGVLLVASAGRPSAVPARIDLCHFSPTFAEDFHSLSVSAWGGNGSRWIAHTPWAGDFGNAAFTDPAPGFPFSVAGGILSIEARKGTDGRWRSGLLASADPQTKGFAQQWGYFEIRAKLPPGPGVWPAFWLATNEPRGSRDPGIEIDVFEYYGHDPASFQSAVHVWDNSGHGQNRAVGHTTPVAPGSLSAGFHTWGADVEPDRITFYFDQRQVWQTATPKELTKPLLVLLDLALGSGWPINRTIDPSVMQVKYVHVFARKPGALRGACRAG